MSSYFLSMKIVLSPSKDLDETPYTGKGDLTEPVLRDKADALAFIMQKKNAQDLKDLMGISDKLAALNVERYQNYQSKGQSNSAKPALFMFTGDVYRSMEVQDFSEDNLEKAQNTIRILSGLYGILKPLDRVQPYRLEMGRKLAGEHGKNLYDYWGNTVTKALADEKPYAVINLASEEYFSVIKPQNLDVPVIHVKFLNEKDGKARVIGLFAKRARGAMAGWVVRHAVEKVSDLKDFDLDGYAFDALNSDEMTFIFKRKQPSV